MSSQEALQRLLGFVQETRLTDVPAAVLADARLSFLDTVGCLLGGARARPALTLARRHAAVAGGAALLGTGLRTSPLYAALVGGVAATWLDLDTGHRHPSSDPPVPAVHPPVHIVPVLFALGEQRHISGRELFRIYLLTYELGARLGIATKLHPAMHVHGVQPTLAAAAAAALILGADLDRTVRLAASLCLMSSMQTALDGGTVRNTYAGLGAANGILAAQLAAAGFTPEADPLRSVFGCVASYDLDPNLLVDRLGEHWETTLGYYKIHACCRWNHPALDALAEAAATPVPAAAVESVEVRTFAFATAIAGDSPRTDLGAKFSIPFAVSAFLHYGSASFRSFTDDTLWDAGVRDLAHRVTVREEPEYSAALPRRRPTTVTVRLRDGSVRSATVQGSRGDPGSRFPAGTLEGKFLELATAAVGAVRAETALARLQAIETVPDVCDLVPLLTRESEAAGTE